MRRWVIGLSAMGLFTGVWMVAQPPPPVPFGEMQFPQFATPPVCDAGRLSHIYYDTDDNLPYYCNGTAWVTFIFSISGTNPFLARFNSAGTNIETSDLRNDGVPAAGVTGQILSVAKTLNILDAGDIATGLSIILTNANHTAGAQVTGIGLTLSGGQDADASETAFVAGSGWDNSFSAIGNGILIAGAANAAGGSKDFIFVGSGIINAMDGNDTVNALSVDLINTTHTGASNELRGLFVDGITASSGATEKAIHIGAGWDRDIHFADDNHPHLYFAATETDAIFDSVDNDPTYNFMGSDSTITLVRFQDGAEITQLMGTDLAVVGAAQDVDPNSNAVEISAGAAASVTTITAPTATSNTEQITFICNGANVTFNDSDAAGAANTINLAGAATNFVCSGDDTLTLQFLVAPAAGNARWVEVARSVN